MPNIKYSKELLEPLVAKSFSVSQVAKELGLPITGGAHTHLSKVIKRLNLDTSHFLGQAIMRGKASCKKKTPEEILIKRTGVTKRAESFRLKRALLESGVELKCKKCLITDSYNQQPITLQVDHINNDWMDDRKENLQFLCPNCHSQKTSKDGSKDKFRCSLKRSLQK